MRRMPLLLLVGYLAACHAQIGDQERIERLQRLCAESASETIVNDSADGPVLLTRSYIQLAADTSDPWRSAPEVRFGNLERDVPIGTARLPALDLEYAPGYLLQTLFIGDDRLREVVFDGSASAPPPQAPCQSRHRYIVVRTPEEAGHAALNACEAEQLRELDTGSLPRYGIFYAYGPSDDHDIRPFVFEVRDRTNGRVLATQHSYQLLLGGMRQPVRHGWGSSQGVCNCPLTPPDQVVKRVFR